MGKLNLFEKGLENWNDFDWKDIPEPEPTIISVTPTPDYHLIIKYENGERKDFDFNPWLRKPQYRILKTYSKFRSVTPSWNSVQWGKDIDMPSEVLYEDSVVIT